MQNAKTTVGLTQEAAEKLKILKNCFELVEGSSVSNSELVDRLVKYVLDEGSKVSSILGESLTVRGIKI